MPKVCPHPGGLTPTTCGECLYEGNYEVPATQPAGKAHPFRARFAGECALCTYGIRVGDMAVKDAKHGTIHYRHTQGAS